ncbi:unnamed protein product [Rotaria sp. Silwood2]|nr:unnamed protein product [Rotaria sp. Silwood2]CAF2688669.1 unnamed protein product [Rotaria sp. Silwood2]CAF2933705.1 unnamed protein product [Rotaria sp. Silwood2]CAF3098372.1 unnamed protein product [Rotaria sp. Silwood2]CAF3932497.1 unnamed protein product [Rotaria sp. Silwood2]
MSSHVTDVEGDWKIVDYPQHSECLNRKIEIKGCGLDPNVFKLDVQLVNHLSCILKHNSTNNQWKISGFSSTEISGSPKEREKEEVFRKLISHLQKLEVQHEEQLIIKTNDGEQVRLQRVL